MDSNPSPLPLAPAPRPQLGLPWWLSGKESACNAGGLGLIHGWGGFPGGVHETHSCLENPMDRGAWRAILYGVQRA